MSVLSQRTPEPPQTCDLFLGAHKHPSSVGGLSEGEDSAISLQHTPTCCVRAVNLPSFSDNT